MIQVQKLNGWNVSPAVLIWSDVMKKVHTGLIMKQFSEDIPEVVVQVEICKKSGFLATSSCRYSGTVYTENFVAGTEPTRNMPISFFYESMYRKWISCKRYMSTC